MAEPIALTDTIQIASIKQQVGLAKRHRHCVFQKSHRCATSSASTSVPTFKAEELRKHHLSLPMAMFLFREDAFVDYFFRSETPAKNIYRFLHTPEYCQAHIPLMYAESK